MQPYEANSLKSYRNLHVALEKEALAKAKYTFYLGANEKDGNDPVLTTLLNELIANENEHCEIWAKELDMINPTHENIVAAIKREQYETSKMYKQFVEDAKADGLYRLATKMELVRLVEGHHHDLLLDYYKKVLSPEEKSVKYTTIWYWKCKKCGNTYLIEDHTQPDQYLEDICSLCGHDKSFFTLIKRKVELL